MLKTVIINILKFSVTAVLIGWLVYSGKLDFKLLSRLFENPLATTAAAFLSFLILLLVSLRWRNLLQHRSVHGLPYTGILKITWIGQFFSSLLPGSVSGDLVKIIYLRRIDSAFSKKFIFASIFVDRLIGLSGLILLVGTSSIFFDSGDTEITPAMKKLLNMNYVLSLLVILSLIAFFTLHSVIRKFLVKFAWFKPLVSFWDYLMEIKPQVLRSIALSLMVQLLSVISFWILIYPYVAEKMTFLQAMTFIPIGLMTLALPIAPSGLGVGHAIFQKLFEFSGIHNGASLFNLWFVVTLVVNLLGSIPYVLAKNKNLGRIDV